LDRTENREHQKNGSVPVTKADAMRIIARTEGVEVTKEMIRKMKRIQK